MGVSIVKQPKGSRLSALSTTAQPIVICALLVGAWESMVRSGIWDATIVPSPSHTLDAAWEFRTTLIHDFGITLIEVVSGFAITICLSILVAVIIHLYPRGTSGTYNLLVILQSVPLWAIAPVLFYWIGPGLAARLVVIVLVAFFPVIASTVEGLRRIDSELLDLFESMDATARQRLMTLEFPSALNMVCVGSKITLTMCLIGAVLSEMLIGDMVGLGYRIREANAHFRVDLVFASIASLSLMMIALYSLLGVVVRQLQPWVVAKEK
jgi:ABC-type nitrate/sulfonate/bicarbonate transport system permease component